MIPKSKSEFISGVNISPELHNAITVNVNVNKYFGIDIQNEIIEYSEITGFLSTIDAKITIIVDVITLLICKV